MYVCDVNGFSLVKSSKKYYIDCANQIRTTIQDKLQRRTRRKSQDIDNFEIMGKKLGKFRPDIPQQKGQQWELRSVVGVFRHGDRTPKQKMKMKTTET